jgi:anti-anti-sigma factor
MKITQHPAADWLELRLDGRLDATWAQHVGDTINTNIHAGAHRIALNFAEVHYISSLGLRVILQYYKQLKSIKGELVVIEPSAAALTIFKTSGMQGFLVSDSWRPDTSTPPAATQQIRGGATYQIFPQPAKVALTCVASGNPEQLAAGGYSQADSHTLKFASGSFGLGLGAFGSGFDDCRERFGEFMAVGGCAIALPTNDQHALPDYVVEEGTLVPQVEALYALTGSGDFPFMIRFDALAEGAGKVGLTELTDALLALSGAETAAFVVLAEVAGMVGSCLRRSPTAGPIVFELPEVRDCLSFTTERTSDKSLALLVGVATRASHGAAFLRPQGGDGAVQAHVHAALFPYRPVQQGELPLGKVVKELLGSSNPTALLHLMPDTRPFEGVGETDLLRGACWVGPLNTISGT